jgi:hypothetical protein
VQFWLIFQISLVVLIINCTPSRVITYTNPPTHPTYQCDIRFAICTWPKTDEWIERYNYLKNTSRTSTFRVKALRRSMGQENRYYNFPINKRPSFKTTKCCLYFPSIVVSFSFRQINIHHLHLRIGKQPQIKALFTRNSNACIEYLRCVWLYLTEWLYFLQRCLSHFTKVDNSSNDKYTHWKERRIERATTKRGSIWTLAKYICVFWDIFVRLKHICVLHLWTTVVLYHLWTYNIWEC